MLGKNIINAAAGAAGEAGNPNAWDISKAYYDAGADAWNVTKTAYAGISKDVSTEESVPNGVFFKPDGTKMYVIGSQGDDVNEYDLSTPWLVSSASYLQNFSVSAKDTIPQGLFFRSDGLRMYFCGSSSASVHEYSLSTAWNISTASFVRTKSVSAQDSTPMDVSFKSDGTKMYVLGFDGDDINEYSLSTAWNISTASYVQNFSVTSQESAPRGLSFKDDGTKVYVCGTAQNKVNEYDLSTAWDISSASYVQNFDVSAQAFNSGQGVYFKPDGTGFYLIDSSGDSVYQYTIGGFSVAAQVPIPQAIFFKDDGTKMYLVGSSGDRVSEYSLSTGWDFSTATYVQNFSVATEENAPSGLFFKSDGTKMYVCGTSGDDVNEYALSVAWDVSTASYTTAFSVAAQDTSPRGVSFKGDGTKMYILGQAGKDVNEYDLSTAWDVSSASYVQNFSVVAQENDPVEIFFKPDGTKMYISGNTGNDVNQYDLSTPWDVATASYVQNLSTIEGEPNGLFFKTDGTQLYVVGSNLDKVLTFSISPE
jgi:sugar lactone lactonase YvrE